MFEKLAFIWLRCHANTGDGSPSNFFSTRLLRANHPHTKLYLDNGDLFFQPAPCSHRNFYSWQVKTQPKIPRVGSVPAKHDRQSMEKTGEARHPDILTCSPLSRDLPAETSPNLSLHLLKQGAQKSRDQFIWMSPQVCVVQCRFLFLFSQ